MNSGSNQPPQDKLLDSNYDGIQEYDNNLPRWWLWLFYFTIVFGVVYAGYYEFGPGLSSAELLALERKEVEKLARASGAANTGISEADLLALASNKAALDKGKAVFVSKCVACHGPDGQGLVGPNLTDDNWIHGGKILQIKTTVENGVLDKGMLAWKALLSGDEINSVVAYIWSIHGTNPANPKAPQGDLVAR